MTKPLSYTPIIKGFPMVPRMLGGRGGGGAKKK